MNLNAIKIASMEEDTGKSEQVSEGQRKTNDVFFLHGLLGKGQNWKSFALNDVLSN